MNRCNSACTTISRPSRHTLATALLATAALVSGAAAATTYRIVELPLPTGAAAGSANGINEAGEVVGSARDDNYRHDAISWGTAPYSPSLLPAGTALDSEAYAINDIGHVVGSARFPGTDDVPVRWGAGGTIVRLAALPGGQSGSWVYDINNRGNAVGGVARTPVGGYPFKRPAIWVTPQWVRWVRGGGTGFGDSEARAVNETGIIVGSGLVGVETVHAFRRTPGGDMQDLGDLPGGRDNSYASDVNDADLAVGTGASATGPRAVLWNTDGSMQDLGEVPNGSAFDYYGDDINNAGEATGRIHDHSTIGFEQGFVWTAATGMQRIVDLIDPLDPLYPLIASGDVRIYVNDINDAGLLVGGLAEGSSSTSIPIVLVPQP